MPFNVCLLPTFLYASSQLLSFLSFPPSPSFSMISTADSAWAWCVFLLGVNRPLRSLLLFFSPSSFGQLGFAVWSSFVISRVWTVEKLADALISRPGSRRISLSLFLSSYIYIERERERARVDGGGGVVLESVQRATMSRESSPSPSELAIARPLEACRSVCLEEESELVERTRIVRAPF